MKRVIFFDNKQISEWAAYHLNLRESWMFCDPAAANLGNTNMRDFLKTLSPARLLKAAAAYFEAGMSDFSIFIYEWAKTAEISTTPELSNFKKLKEMVESLEKEKNEWTFWNSVRNDPPLVFAVDAPNSEIATSQALKDNVVIRREGCIWILENGKYSTIGKIKKCVK